MERVMDPDNYATEAGPGNINLYCRHCRYEGNYNEQWIRSWGDDDFVTLADQNTAARDHYTRYHQR